MAKCRWEEDECIMRAEGGEFYCLTHLQESEDAVWKFANAGDPPGTTRKLTLEETEAHLERLRNRGKPVSDAERKAFAYGSTLLDERSVL